MSALEEQVGGNHYKDMPIQPIEFCQKNRLGYAESLAIKYICRHGRKGGRQDIDKAIHYLELLKTLEYPNTIDQWADDVLQHLSTLQTYCYSCGRLSHGREYCADCEAMRGVR
jgi:hypothetical protein